VIHIDFQIGAGGALGDQAKYFALTTIDVWEF